MDWWQAVHTFDVEFEAARERFRENNYSAWLFMECLSTAIKELMIGTFVIFWACLFLGRIH